MTSYDLAPDLTSDPNQTRSDDAFLGAVHGLLASSRAATKADLILAGACQSLRSGDKTTSEVLSVVNLIWPGARTDLSSVEAALRLGTELGLVAQTEGLGNSSLWTLTTRGVDDVDGQANWVAALRKRSAGELAARAAGELGVQISDSQADTWLEALVRALIDGIQSSQDAYFGRVESAVGKRLTPRHIDQDAVFDRLNAATSNPATKDFLRATALAAFDPLDDFGNELVSMITTGCVLHSYVAGRDSSSLMDKIGRPDGQRAVIDTPVLLDLIGPARVRHSALTTIRTALQANWDVVVAEHSLDELATVVEREIPRIKESFTQARDRGVKEEWYAALTDSQLPAYCVEVLREGTYRSLDEMVQAALDLGHFLSELGVTVRPHGNDSDSTHVARCHEALNQELLETRARSNTAIDRDADTLAMVWRRRRRQTGSQWPGGWVITPDRHLAPAFRKADPQDKVPISLSMAQWSTLLSATVPPANVMELAEAAAGQLIEEAMWLLPSRFPSEVAMSLARQIGPDSDGSELDLRFAQLELTHTLDSAGERRTPTALAADVLSARTARQKTIQAIELDTAKQDAHAAREKVIAAEAVAAREMSDAQAARRSAEAERSESAKLRGDLAWARKRTSRIVAVVLAAAIMVIFGLAGVFGILAPIVIAIAAIGLVLTLFFGIRWCSAPNAKLLPVVIAAVVDGVGVIVGVWDLATRLLH